MKRLLLLFIFVQFSFCQTVIKGEVKTKDDKSVAFANVQVYRQGSNIPLCFKSTNSTGAFEFSIIENEKNITIKITHISYFSKSIDLNIENKKEITQNFILETKETQLETVKITGKFKDVNDKNDTVKYNLKNLLNGSESKLKDVINKLPGLKIDENGKIKFNGKTIDNFLIEGDELYNNQHQLATENIQAQIIDKIEVLKNYKDFSTIGSNEGQGNKTALNVYIKEEYKNAINGVCEAEGGYKKRYKLHNYFYNFNKKAKTSLITDINNINAIVFNVNDYFELKKISNQEINSIDANNSLTIDDNVPDFLFAQDDVKNKTIKNVTLNLNTKISKNTKIQGYSVGNLLLQNQFINTQQIFYANENSTVNRISNIDGHSLFNSNYIKIENKPNDKNYFGYTLSINYSRNNQYSAISNTFQNFQSNFDEKKITEDFVIGQNFSSKKILSPKSKLDFILYSDIANVNNSIAMSSTQPFLGLNFDSTNFYLTQNTNQKRFKFGGKAKYNFKINKNSFNFQIGSSLLNENYTNYLDELNPNYNLNIQSNFYNNYIGLSYFTTIYKKIRLSVGSDLNYNISSFDTYADSKKKIILPFASINYNLNSKINLGVSYKKDVSLNTINQFIKGNVLSNYQNIFSQNDLLNNLFLTSSQYTFSFSHLNFDKNFNIFFNTIYTKKDRNIGINTFNVNNTFFNKNILVNFDNTFMTIFNCDKKFKQKPFGFNIQVMSLLNNKQTYTNDIPNEIESQQNKIDFSCISYLKDNDFNFSFGIGFTHSITKNITTNLTNSFQKITPFLNFNGVILNDKWNWELNNSYIVFKSSSYYLKNILDIKPKIIYKKNNWSFYFSGNNILNVKDNNFKAKSSSNNFSVEQSLYNSLPGYVNIGTLFSF